MAKRSRAIGFIMDNNEMRAVEVSGTPQRFKVAAMGCVPLRASLMQDGMIYNMSTAYGLMMQLFSKESGFVRETPVVIGVKNQNVILRMASFPKVPPDKMRNTVMYQAQQFIPIPITELILDYVECDTVEGTDSPTVNVLLTGAKKVFLDNLLTLFTHVKRTVVDIDSALLATMRAVSAIHKHDGNPYMFIDIDHENIGMVICRDDTILVARTAAHTTHFYNLVAGFHEDATLSETAVTDLIGYLAGNARTFIQFFATQNRTPIGKIYLISRLKQTGAIAAGIGEILSMNVAAPHMYPSSLTADAAAYGACISLALRGLGG